MSNDSELLVKLKDSVAILTLNRPERRNALSTTLLISLAQALKELADNRDVRCVIIRGAGEKAFSAGMDLTAVPEGVPEELKKQIDAKGPLQFGLDAIEEYPFPVIAMIRGFAVGAGCEMTMACDLRIGASNARMGMPPARLGIVYPPEGLRRFIRNLGLPTTKKLFLTARIFDGEEVQSMGLMDYVFGEEELEERTMGVAEVIAKNAPLSIIGHKRSLFLLTKAEPLRDDDRGEIDDLMMKALGSEDAQEGLTAFIQKRDPVFKGQ